MSSDLCPECGRKGPRIDPITLKALLSAEGLLRGVPPAPRFCATEGCPVVYFDRAVPVRFDENVVFPMVSTKHPTDPEGPLCYCFGFTRGMVVREIDQTGASTVSATVSAAVKAGHCACEVKNPGGACCLGDIVRFERGLVPETRKRPGGALGARNAPPP